MGKLYAWEFMSIDGIMESPEKWIHPYSSEDVWDFIRNENLSAESMILGKLTYEAFITFWPHQKNNEFGFADRLNKMPKYVVSSSLKNADWNNTKIIDNNILEEVQELKSGSTGDIGMTGSAKLFQFFLQHDVLDEIHLLVYPIVLGSGIRLFGDVPQSGLTLWETKVFHLGVVLLSYKTNPAAR